ncbi:MAG: hypothetical protein O7H41_20955 [Planctomycetota bacterium]|nr:hypothetical protein [Planctomycetota bacterium]
MSGDLEITGISCDACSKSLLVEESVRYVVDIRVYAAYDPLEITQQDYREDRREEIRQLLEACEKMSAEELEDQVYRSFRFHLCPGCQRRYLRGPLDGLRGSPPPGQTELIVDTD